MNLLHQHKSLKSPAKNTYAWHVDWHDKDDHEWKVPGNKRG